MLDKINRIDTEGAWPNMTLKIEGTVGEPRVVIPAWQLEEIKNDVLEFAAQLCEAPAWVNGCAGRAGGETPKTAAQCAAAIRGRKSEVQRERTE